MRKARGLLSEEVFVMKNSIMKFETCIGKLGLQIAKRRVNTACCFIQYQEKLPDVAKKLKKF